jgi:hypothetical protein
MCRSLHDSPSTSAGEGKQQHMGNTTRETGERQTLADTAAAAVGLTVCESGHIPQKVPGGVVLAASVSYDDPSYLGPGDIYRSWLVDTGSKHDLATLAALPTCQLGFISKAPVTILLATAYDLVNGDNVVHQQIGELGEVAEL